VDEDNKSAILLETMASVPRARSDQCSLFIHFRPSQTGQHSDQVLPNQFHGWRFFTKPLQGPKFVSFRDLVLGKTSVSSIEIDGKSVLAENSTAEVQTDMCREPTTTSSVFVDNRPY
jgi:hypothetical protein